VTQISQ